MDHIHQAMKALDSIFAKDKRSFVASPKDGSQIVTMMDIVLFNEIS
jgi:hypothetical protein